MTKRFAWSILWCLSLTAAYATPAAVAAKRAAATAPAGDLQPATDAAAAAATTRPARVAGRMLIISVDGLRPDVLLRARAPRMHALAEAGCFSYWARTTPHAITLPSHTSMLTGVVPRKHEVEWNKDLPLKEPVYPNFPTLFLVARRAGYTTAMAAGKSKFETLAMPDSLDWSFIPSEKKGEDADVASHATAIIREHKPEVMFVHFPSTDNVGHKVGWGTPEQVRTVEAADGCVGRVLGALADAGVAGETVVLLTSDHGGAGLTHLPDDARARHIPWIIAGPGIRTGGVDLTTYPKLVIDTEDTFVTACYLLGIPLGPDLDGKPILEVLQDRGELLHTADGGGRRD